MDNEHIPVSPAKKNPRGKPIGTGQRKIVINLYKDLVTKQSENPGSPRLSYREMIIEISKSSGIGQRTVQTTLSEYKNLGTVSSPSKKRLKLTIIKKIDEFDKNAIRQKIHQFWRNREVPTIKKMLTAINEDETLPNIKRTSFQAVLKDLQFEYLKKNRNSALLEREDLITWRRNFIGKIKHYRAQNIPIYYLDETWVNAGETHSRTWLDTTVKSSRDAFLKGLTTGQKEPSGKGKRLIVLHTGSSDGFVPGGILCFKSKTNSTDYHDEMNGDTFYEWFVRILPLLKANAIIVMDNASYHSVKKFKIPNMSWKKQEIIDWLENKDNNKVVLRLPPYHCELNPIEVAWSSVKSYAPSHNNTFKIKDLLELLKKGVEHVTPEMWTNFVGHVVKEEDKFLNIEHLSDEIIDGEPDEGERHILTIGTAR
ncbi:unnamed protein product [Macrosiphum euphorbiae]|uniref:Tc1-like transposase DDE domain-containing protein n=1 Tax=Macrosiphum euphorbiae TaxID=13131 RepID=A0AAV0WRV0_9HEMI|nr:unnamed protein product [Macrosiphum euphorbiae]